MRRGPRSEQRRAAGNFPYNFWPTLDVPQIRVSSRIAQIRAAWHMILYYVREKQ